MAKHYLGLSQRLQELLYDKRMNASELAREVGLPVPTVHRLVTGKSTRPYKSSLKPIADYFSLSVDQLIGEEPLVEVQTFATLPANKKQTIELPLYEWAQLSQIRENSAHPDESIIVMNDLSAQCFALKMNDSSMMPQFPKGSVLIFDPTKEPFDRSFVLVQLVDGDNLFVFRELILDANHRFIRALAPDLTGTQLRLLDEGDEVVAVLVEARQSYGNF
ncbi:MAG: helix-turn-helix domain-containing protein [Legionellales bacterium]|nr:helix-turn-helix domain-containing protein [Legionellales bacterium]